MAAFKNTRGLGWVGGCLIVFVLGVVVIGGLGFLGFRKAMSQAAEEITAQLKDHPVIVERIGDITEIEQQLTKGPEHLTTAQIENGWWLWSIEGTKGKGLLKVQLDTGSESKTPFKLVDGELLMGEASYPLFVKKKVDGPGKPEKPSGPEKPAESLPNPK